MGRGRILAWSMSKQRARREMYRLEDAGQKDSARYRFQMICAMGGVPAFNAALKGLACSPLATRNLWELTPGKGVTFPILLLWMRPNKREHLHDVEIFRDFKVIHTRSGRKRVRGAPMFVGDLESALDSTRCMFDQFDAAIRLGAEKPAEALGL